MLHMHFGFEKPRRPKPTDKSTSTKIEYQERWEHYNCMCMANIKTRIQRSIQGAIPNCGTAREFLEAIDKQFKPTDKQMGGSIMLKLCAMKLIGGIQDANEWK
ncbi:hypothetical protein K1719_020830 [Acacia pycnantha]|nr:hypothetical protein K1719_020830 [Acacia pycnantha]